MELKEHECIFSSITEMIFLTENSCNRECFLCMKKLRIFFLLFLVKEGGYIAFKINPPLFTLFHDTYELTIFISSIIWW